MWYSWAKWRRQWQPTPVLLPGKSHGWRSLVGCSPWGHEESDTTERLHFHFLLSCIEGGNGNPLQCSCLKNPRDGGAWWAAVYGVTQSQTWLKQLSSSSTSLFCWFFCPGSFDFGVWGRRGELESFYSPILSSTPYSIILEIRIGFLGASGQRSQLMPNGRWHPPPPSVDR